MKRALVLLAAVWLGGCAGRPLPLAGGGLDPSAPVPRDLRDTGLYSNFSALTIKSTNRPYAPAFALWSDGADKSRWIYLPPGKTIDVSDVDEWTFPVGTIVWKEFRWNGVRIETRMLWKRKASAWEMVTYVWSPDQKSATLASATDPPPVPFPGTDAYEVPVLRCQTCHERRKDRVLGFEAVLLAAPEADGLTYASLRDQGLISSAGALPDEAELQLLPGASPTERQAVGYLHANCGITCHHAGSGEITPFYLRLESPIPTSIEDTQVYKTAIDQPSKFTPMGQSGTFYRIRPTDESRSTLYYRMHVRNGLAGGGEQMPPIASHVVDAAGCKLIQDWIDSMTTAPYPSPAP